tara:strand:+ start:251 stop:808 length:558 start_codon:yes stop_codon:yes gene_type:complete
MGFLDKWNEKRRVSALNRVNKELEILKKKENFFEKKDSYAAKIDVPGKVKDSVKKLKIIAIILFLLWAITLFVYMGKVANLKVERNELSNEVSLKMSAMENITNNINLLHSEIEGLEKSEGDISKDYNDLKDLNDILEDQIDDLEDEISDLNTNLTNQVSLVSKYELCIVDNSGFNSSLSTCNNY